MQHPQAAWPGLVVLLLAGIVCVIRPTRWMCAPLAATLLALLPVLGFVPFDFQYFSTPADRYMYLPMFGIAFLTAGFMMRVRGMIPWTLALVAMLMLGLRSFDQTSVWQDTPSLVARQLTRDPGSSTGHKIQAVWLLAENRHGETEQEFAVAITAIQQVLQGGRRYLVPVRQYASWSDGNAAEAIQMYQDEIGRTPPDQLGMAYDNLGLAYFCSGKTARSASSL